MKTYFIKIYGCLFNYADALLIEHALNSAGYVKVSDYSNADVIILVTCSIRQKAEDKTLAWKNRIKKLDKKPIVILTGCMVRRDYQGNRINQNIRYLKGIHLKNPWIDIFLDITKLKDLPKVLDNYTDKSSPLYIIEDRDINYMKDFKNVDIPLGSIFSYIPIMTGCNEFCTYCIVPYSRGKEYFFKYNDILDSVKHSLDSGSKILVLLGQIVDKWKDLNFNKNFLDLLYDIINLNYDFWLYFTSPHPNYITKDVIDIIADSPKIMNFLGLPLQSGSDRILRAMNRKYTVDKYLSIVEYAKAKIPNLYLTTDIIIGFPPETEEDFQETMNVIKKVKFDKVFFAKYSPRHGIHKELVQTKRYQTMLSDRFNRFRLLVDQIFYKKNKEEIGKSYKAIYLGNKKFVSFRNQLVDVLDSTEFEKGKIYDIQIIDGGRRGVVGKVMK